MNAMQTHREDPVPQTQASSVLSGSLILNRVHSFAGWCSAEIKIHKFARLKSSHLAQDSWKDMGMEMVVWHVGSEEHSRAVLHPGVVYLVPGAILLLREWKIRTVGVLSFSKITSGIKGNCKQLSYCGLRSWLITRKILTNHLHASDSLQLRNIPYIFSLV